MKILIIMIKNIIINYGIIQSNIEKLEKIKEIYNQIFWEINNFMLQYKLNCGFKDDKSDIKIISEYKNRIKELIKKGSDLINYFFDYDIEFNPDNLNDDINFSINPSSNHYNSFNSSYKHYNFSYIEFSCKSKDKSSKEYEFLFKCFKCSNNNPKFLCKYCNILFCDECFKDFHHCSSKNDLIINFQENEEKEMTLFLNSISAIFKNILIKCNYLLKIESKKNVKIKKKIKFPYISDFFLSEQIKFLKDIENEIDFDNNFNNSFDILDIESNLIDIIKIILYKEPILNLILKDYSEIEDDEESSGEFVNE